MDVNEELSETLWSVDVTSIVKIAIVIWSLRLFGYYMALFYDWILDEIILVRALRRYRKAARAEREAGLTCTSILLEKHAQNIPDHPFLLFLDQRYTFRDVNSKANQLANLFNSLGFSRDQTVSLFMRNKPEFVFVHFACLKLAVPLAFLNTNLKSKSLLHCIRHSSTKFLIVDKELVEEISDIVDELEKDGVRVLVYGECSEHISLTQLSQFFSAKQPDSTARKGITPNDICIYIFTSGTTGLPKAAKILYSMNLSTVVYTYVYDMSPDDVIYDPLPLYHRAASAFLNMALYKGIPFAFAPKFSASQHWRDCYRFKATIVNYIGESCRYLLSTEPTEYDTTHKVRVMIGNGIRKEIWKDFQDRFNIPQIREGYGSTEGICVFLNLRGKIGSVGKKYPRLINFLTNRLVGERGRAEVVKYSIETGELERGKNGQCVLAPRGTPGLLLAEITSANKFSGYINDLETSKKIIKNVLREGDAYFNTGDLMLWDTDYYVYFVDRIGDTFRWKGENVSTQEVGSLISDLDIIEDCSVYGVSIPGMDGKCGMSAIVLKTGISPTPDVLKAIHSQCEHHLPSYARPVFLRFMQSLHLTATFKHQKYNLERESFDVTQGSQIYVRDLKQQTYLTLTSQVYENIINGNMKM